MNEAQLKSLEDRLRLVELALNNQTPNPSLPVGSIIAFGNNFVPSEMHGYLLCDGVSLSRSTYNVLFGKIGTAWGTADANSFNVPDLRGIFLRMRDRGSARDPYPLDTWRGPNNIGGNEGDNVGSVSWNVTYTAGYRTGMPQITSPFYTDGAGSHRHTLNLADGTGSYSAYFGNTHQQYTSDPSATNYAGHHGHSIASGGDLETAPKNAYVDFIIKYI